jgi:hypothetical protein
MKKSRGVKRKVNHSKRQKKSSRYLRFLPAVFILAVFAVFVLSVALHPATGNVISGQADAPTGSSTLGAGTSFISDLFTQWQAGQLDVNIAKYLFWLMLTGLIWGALSFAKFPEKGVFQALIAIPVGFLVTAYITPTEVFTILTSYTALGITLSFLVPFMILLFVSAMLTSNEKIKQMSVPKVMLETFLWIFYIVILGYKMISGLVQGEIKLELTLPILIMIGVFGISCLIVVFNSRFRRWMWNIGLDIRKAQAEAARVEATESMRTATAAEKSRESSGL